MLGRCSLALICDLVTAVSCQIHVLALSPGFCHSLCFVPDGVYFVEQSNRRLQCHHMVHGSLIWAHRRECRIQSGVIDEEQCKACLPSLQMDGNPTTRALSFSFQCWRLCNRTEWWIRVGGDSVTRRTKRYSCWPMSSGECASRGTVSKWEVPQHTTTPSPPPRKKLPVNSSWHSSVSSPLDSLRQFRHFCAVWHSLPASCETLTSVALGSTEWC